MRLDPNTAIPPFEQIRAQLALQVATGRLQPSERLPTVRTLASQLGVSPNTVARAYRELIRSGICTASGRRGTFVASDPPIAHNVATRSEALRECAAEFVSAVNHLGVPIDEALEAMLAAFRAAAMTTAAEQSSTPESE